MASSDGMFLRELHKLMRTVDKLTAGQAKIDIDDQELECETDTAFILFITPNDGCYKGATCKFKVVIPSNYPESPPSVSCLNRIYHPNIDIPEDESGAPICVNLLDRDWKPHVGLDGCVMAVLFLFYNPNPDDPLSRVFGAGIDDEEFEKNVRASLRGEMVEDMVFDKLLNDEEGDNDCQLEDKPVDCNNGEITVNETVNEDMNADTNTNNNNNSQNVKETLTESEDWESETAGQSKDTSQENNNKDIGENTIDDLGTNEIISNNSTQNTSENQEFGDIAQTPVLKEADDEHGEKAKDCVYNAELRSSVFENESGHQLKNVTDQDDIIDDRAKKLLRTSSEQKTSLNIEEYSDQSHDVGSPSTSRFRKVESETYSNECVALQTLSAACLAETTKGRGPIVWHKTLSIFGRVYRWLTSCTRSQSYDVYVVSRADLKQR